MSVLGDVYSGLKKILVVEARIDQQSRDLSALRDRVWDHESRLSRIEALVEIAQSRNAGGAPPRD